MNGSGLDSLPVIIVCMLIVALLLLAASEIYRAVCVRCIMPLASGDEPLHCTPIPR